MEGAGSLPDACNGLSTTRPCFPDDLNQFIQLVAMVRELDSLASGIHLRILSISRIHQGAVTEWIGITPNREPRMVRIAENLLRDLVASDGAFKRTCISSMVNVIASSGTSP